ncbi:hypothetical protein KGF54_002256 [Candida jiufengensis]|uniref:uncharacterized protein n=1 Tax=Candida jiufengensis TaxID=497108 RepID=UPI0022254D29|nr:uncharacterized protein KGF54_002256 [Candida jiufengensis]KAI5954481.1 hypothetical protein KGF54_002256 [Candida jiufengensis]
MVPLKSILKPKQKRSSSNTTNPNENIKEVRFDKLVSTREFSYYRVNEFKDTLNKPTKTEDYLSLPITTKINYIASTTAIYSLNDIDNSTYNFMNNPPATCINFIASSTEIYSIKPFYKPYKVSKPEHNSTARQHSREMFGKVSGLDCFCQVNRNDINACVWVV